MGLIRAKIEVVNSDDVALHRRGYLRKEEIRKMEINALVDTGAYMMAINETIQTQLGLAKLGEELFENADGSKQSFEIVGPVDIHFENRRTVCRALKLPGNAEPLLGSIPLEDMDVLIDPKQQRLIVNPLHPYIPEKPLK
ncbi:MAG: clan AA aspartic protease [Verrucomicrobia bacterium]|nr:clan AA aspartic protease [Verrucomicrobiota bacterium]